VCGETARLAVALRSDAATASTAAQLPSAAHVWWRAQLKARQEAACAAGRPITAAEGLAAASAAGVAAAAIVAWMPGMWALMTALGAEVRQTLAARAAAAVQASEGAPQLALAFSVLLAGLLLAPVALYLMFAEESTQRDRR
jgi:hypothetical protein